MASMKWRSCLALPILLAFLLQPAGARAESGVVWLTASSQGDSENVRIRIPLEWMANADRDGHSNIRFDEETVDCTALWLEHKDLPAGESREVRHGVTKDGEAYAVDVVSEKPSSRRAAGKIHILSYDREGESTDIRFPLDVTGFFQQLGSFVGSFFGVESSMHKTTKSRGIDADGIGDLKKLADYGPFVFLESNETDGSKVRISLE